MTKIPFQYTKHKEFWLKLAELSTIHKLVEAINESAGEDRLFAAEHRLFELKNKLLGENHDVRDRCWACDFVAKIEKQSRAAVDNCWLFCPLDIGNCLKDEKSLNRQYLRAIAAGDIQAANLAALRIANAKPKQGISWQ